MPWTAGKLNPLEWSYDNSKWKLERRRWEKERKVAVVRCSVEEVEFSKVMLVITPWTKPWRTARNMRMG